MSLEDQLGSIQNRARQIAASIVAIEQDMQVEKDKLTRVLADIKLLQEQLRPRED